MGMLAVVVLLPLSLSMHDGELDQCGGSGSGAVKYLRDETLIIRAKFDVIYIFIFTIRTISRGLNEAPSIL